MSEVGGFDSVDKDSLESDNWMPLGDLAAETGVERRRGAPGLDHCGERHRVSRGAPALDFGKHIAHLANYATVAGARERMAVLI